MDPNTNSRIMETTVKPFVTLLCSNFNSQQWIEGYLESINNQIENNVRIIFVDAGSTDGSLETIKRFRFRAGITHMIIEEPGCTVYQAWNIAINKSTTDYVMNLNTDDRLFNYGLITAKHVAQNNPDADMIYFPCFETDSTDHSTVSKYHRRDIPFNLDSLNEHCICGPFPLLKTQTIKELGGFSETLKIGGDYDMWVRMAYAGKKLLPSIEPIGSYYNNPQGISTDEQTRMLHFEEDKSTRRKHIIPTQKKVIAFSLWGDNPVYTKGAIRNAELAKTVYPGWVCRFYVGTSTPEDIITTLEGMDNCKEEEGDWKGMFWRFEPASDPDVDVMISRDCDSRLNSREAAAVTDWLERERRFHIMRDHPYHGTPILGGMWGVKGQWLSNMKEMMNAYDQEDRWQTDQEFLKEKIYPIVEHWAHVHDEFFQQAPFPMERKGKLFVGQAYNENDEPLHPEHMDVL